MASVWCKDKRAQTFENKVRFEISDPELPRIDPKIVHQVLLLESYGAARSVNIFN